MKNLKPLFCLLLAIALLACEEQSTDNEPDLAIKNFQLSRVEVFTEGELNNPLVTEYTYENGLLKTESVRGAVITYHYTDRILTRKVYEHAGATITTTYAIEGDKLVERIENILPTGQIFNTMVEYLSISDSEMNINHYRVEDGQAILDHYNECAISNGNIDMDWQYRAGDTEVELTLENQFNNLLNPISLWEGHPQVVSKHQLTNSKTYFKGDLVTENRYEVVQFNDQNLPTEVVVEGESFLNPGLVSRQTVKYYYD